MRPSVSCDFVSLAVGGVRSLEPYQPGKPLEELQREFGITEPLKLASNENPLGPSPLALKALQERYHDVSVYPDGNGYALKQALARHLGVDPECITLGNGSNDVLELVARAFLGPGRAAVFSEHAFAVYPIVTQAVGATARIAKANSPQSVMPYGHDLASIAQLIDQDVRVVFVANPNNPTGTYVTRTELERFLASTPEDTIVVVDEAYFEYVREPDYPNSLDWLMTHPGMVVTRTFSKIYGLAGLRVGYCVSHPQIAELLNRVRQPFNVNGLAQVAALAALDDEQHLHESVRINTDGLEELVAACGARELGYIPSVANFLCIDVGGSALPVYQSLLRQGVIVRPVANYGLPNHLRVTVGRGQDNERVMLALDEALGR